jgi:hypothetical protein
MAIANEQPRIEVEILIDRAPAKEYEDEEKEEHEANASTRYIEARSGTKFEIRYRFAEKLQYDVLVDAFIDGKCLRSGFALLKDFHNGTLEHTFDGVRSNNGGKWLLSRFSFSDLNTGMRAILVNIRKLTLVIVDSAGGPKGDQLMEDLKSMGQITINFHYVTNLRLVANGSTKTVQKTIVKDVPEKALKGRALSHQST